MRKANEAVQPRTAMHSPHEFSRVKYERECKMQESARAYRQQLLQQQKVHSSPIHHDSDVDSYKAQKTTQQSSQPNNGSHGMQPGRPPVPGVPNGASPNINPPIQNSNHAQPGQGNTTRPVPPLPRIMNNSQPNLGLSVPGNPQGVPHAPMQSHPMQQQRVQPPMSSNDMRIYQEVNRVQQEQQRFLAQQRQQHSQSNGQPGASASPNMGHPKAMSQSNSTTLLGLQGRSGSPTTNVSSAVNGSSSSPRMTTINQPQPLSNGMIPAVNQISNQLKTHNPHASPELITRMTTDTLNYRVSQAAVQAAAMHAAAGTGAPSLAANVNGINSLPQPQIQPQIMNGVGGSPGMLQYAQMMRNQQSSQQNRNSASAMNSVGQANRGATPQTHRSGSAQSGPPPSQSPRPSQAQMAGGQ